jgi:hypothetical protein
VLEQISERFEAQRAGRLANLPLERERLRQTRRLQPPHRVQQSRPIRRLEPGEKASRCGVHSHHAMMTTGTVATDGAKVS